MFGFPIAVDLCRNVFENVLRSTNLFPTSSWQAAQNSPFCVGTASSIFINGTIDDSKFLSKIALNRTTISFQNPNLPWVTTNIRIWPKMNLLNTSSLENTAALLNRQRKVHRTLSTAKPMLRPLATLLQISCLWISQILWIGSSWEASRLSRTRVHAEVGESCNFALEGSWIFCDLIAETTFSKIEILVHNCSPNLTESSFVVGRL